MEEELKAKEEEFEKEKQKFAEENPEIAAQLDDTQLMDGNNDPQFKAIFDVQNHIQVNFYNDSNIAENLDWARQLD